MCRRRRIPYHIKILFISSIDSETFEFLHFLSPIRVLETQLRS